MSHELRSEEEESYLRLVEAELVDAALASPVCYLDHAGAAIAPKSLLLECSQDLLGSQMMGNPHSRSTYEVKIHAARAACLAHFRASPDDYDCVFTSGATHALKLVGEVFDYGEEGQLLYPQNVHTSVLGMREYAARASTFPGCHLHTLPLPKGDDSGGGSSSSSSSSNHLLVVPGECNFAGSKVALAAVGAWVLQLASNDVAFARLQEASTVVKGIELPPGVVNGRRAVWWLLDAAKLAGTSPVDLSSLSPTQQPHFVVSSFYKIFGYPTGLGLLLVRRDAAPLLRRRYFGGGTVLAVASESGFVHHRPELHDRWEDGTPHYQGIAAVPRGFACLARLGGMAAIQKHAAVLTRALALHMAAMRHQCSGRPLCTLYGRHDEDTEGSLEAYIARQGPVIAFSLHWADGSPVGFDEVSSLAALEGLCLRTGCFCNPGACQAALGMSARDIEDNLSLGRSCAGEGGAVLNGRPTGCVRVSLGWSSLPRDTARFMRFLDLHFLNKQPSTHGTVPALSLDLEKSCAESAVVREAERKGPWLAEMYVYPVKSCGGVRVSQWPLGPSGLLLDREWAVVDPGGRVLTQKQCPSLALVEVALDLHGGLLLVGSRGKPMAPLPLALGDNEDLARALERASTCHKSSIVGRDCGASSLAVEGSESMALFRDVRVCGQSRRARPQGQDEHRASEWFSAFLGVRCFLLRRGEHVELPNSPTATPGPFYNEAQLLLVNAASLRAHWAAMQAGSVDGEPEGKSEGAAIAAASANFRPNLVVAGCAAHSEDDWATVRLPGSLTLEITGPCQRCSVININGSTGEVDTRALASLASYRRKLTFGMFCKLTVGEGGGEVPFYLVAEGCPLLFMLSADRENDCQVLCPIDRDES